jgi:outer membrane protein TolC
VYDFGKISTAVDLSRQKAESFSSSLELVKTGLAYRTIQVFYTILFLRQSIGVQNGQIDALEEHLAVARKKSQSGTATEFDVLTTQVHIAAAQNTRSDLLNDVQKEEALFRHLLGLPANAGVRLRGDFTQAQVTLDADSLATLAMTQRIELKESRNEEQVAELQSRAASLRDRPALNVSLAWGLKNGYIPNLEVLRGNWVVGFEADIPIFDGFLTRNEEEEAEANRHAAEAHSRETERLILTEVQQSVSDVRNAAGKIQTSALEVEQAQAALEIARVRYEAGVATNLDLIDAQTAVAQAELARLGALREYVLSRFALDRAVGEKLY